MTPEPSLHDRLALAASAWFDRQHQAVATRLSVAALPGVAPPPAGALWAWLAAQWPAGLGPLVVNPMREDWVDATALAACQAPQLRLEAPAFLAPALLDPQAGLAPDQRVLRLGAPGTVPPGTGWCVLPAAPGAGQVAGVAWVLAGADQPEAALQALAQGAAAVQGWPLEDVAAPRPATGRRAPNAELRVVTDLLQRLDRDESPARLEAVLKGAPALGFRLLRYLNSPGFGLAVEVQSFQHAVMLLGSQRLRRWLALLLASSADDPRARPLMLLAVRRALLMESLLPEGDPLRGEAFLCGVFSLLDRMLGQPMPQLLADLPVAQAVGTALLDRQGPLAPLLALAEVAEREVPQDVVEAAADLLLTPGEVNRALWRALVLAQRLLAG
ncbi:HDOD domain-containing protein [Ideonella livida]|uniref:HDOD domain-containing protein n=1 Tax=Ideonella livida TaxID=2707176 RepID=A0A7C9TJY3_9BURK|nr:HDOD domain-containing protein [Ideonella livida]NDY89946.1 HDOD domain-containing protein [Ideonella livida]